MAARAAAAVSRTARVVQRRALRVAHLSDIHFQRFPRMRDLLHVKRVIGVTNLYVGGRHKQFSLEVQRAAVQTIRDLKPDVVVVSGDLTAIGTDDEFALARDELTALLDAQPSLVIPGNHDTYIASAVKAKRFEHYFGRWMGGQHADALGVFTLHHTPQPQPQPQPQQAASDTAASAAAAAAAAAPALKVLGLNPCRPTLIGSTGFYPPQQLTALRTVLDSLAPSAAAASAPASASASASGAGAGAGADAGSVPFVLLATHYPVMHYSGKVYERAKQWHGVTNGEQLLHTLSAAAVSPNAIVHGHEHRGFRAFADVRGGAVPIFDAGAAGNTFSDGSGRTGHYGSRRYAAFNVYHISHSHETADANANANANANAIADEPATASAGAPQKQTPPPLAPAFTGAHLPLPSTAPRGYRMAVQRFVHDGTAFVWQNVPYKDSAGTRPATEPFPAQAQAQPHT